MHASTKNPLQSLGPRWHVASRIAAAILGGYAFTWGVTSLSAMLLFHAGMDFGEATSFASMLGLVLYLVVFCWVFAVPRVSRAWWWLVGGGAVMTLAGWLLSHVPR